MSPGNVLSGAIVQGCGYPLPHPQSPLRLTRHPHYPGSVSSSSLALSLPSPLPPVTPLTFPVLLSRPQSWPQISRPLLPCATFSPPPSPRPCRSSPPVPLASPRTPILSPATLSHPTLVQRSHPLPCSLHPSLPLHASTRPSTPP